MVVPWKRRQRTLLDRAGLDSANPLRSLTEYDLRHLLMHLIDAGHPEHVHQLLRLEHWTEGPSPQAHRRNAWYEAKRAHGIADSYFADVALARELVIASVDKEVSRSVSRPPPDGHGGSEQLVSRVALEIRYALLDASLRSVAGATVHALGVQFAESGRWTTDQAIEYARQSPIEIERARSLLHLAPPVSDRRRVELVDEAMSCLVRPEADTGLLVWQVADLAREFMEVLRSMPAATAGAAASRIHGRDARFRERSPMVGIRRCPGAGPAHASGNGCAAAAAGHSG